MIYLDSNVFISAALYGDDDEHGRNARKIIKEVRLGDDEASTSTLTFDEVYWIVKKEKDKQSALKIVKAMLNMRNLRFVSVDKSILWRTYDILDGEDLGPRDSIHLACARGSGADLMISDDSDFDRIEDLKNSRIKDLVEMIEHKEE